MLNLVQPHMLIVLISLFLANFFALMYMSIVFESYKDKEYIKGNVIKFFSLIIVLAVFIVSYIYIVYTYPLEKNYYQEHNLNLFIEEYKSNAEYNEYDIEDLIEMIDNVGKEFIDIPKQVDMEKYLDKYLKQE